MTKKKEIKIDNFFQELSNTDPYFKSAIHGQSGSGKTYTASLIAMGLHKRIKSKKPIIIFDSEKASRFLVPLFKEHNIKGIARISESLADLEKTLDKMKEGASDILIIDSGTRVWDNLVEEHKERRKKLFMTMYDWMLVKEIWKKKFMDRFLNESYHVILCGRAGDVYTDTMNEDTGKREFYKSGVKMRGGKEDVYETSLLIYMDKHEEIIGPKNKKIWREATILKDRNTDKNTTLDGKVFINPTYKDFEPAIEAAIINPVKSNVEPINSAADLIKTDEGKKEWMKQKDIILDKIQIVLSKSYPTASAENKANKQNVCEEAFGVENVSWIEIEGFSLKRLEEGYKKIGKIIEKQIKKEKKK